MKNFSCIICIIISILSYFQFCLAEVVAEVVNGDMTFCHFGPKFKIISPNYSHKNTFNNTNTVNNTFKNNDYCTGTAKVQGVMYACVLPANVEVKVAESREQIRKQAIEECKKHCECV